MHRTSHAARRLGMLVALGASAGAQEPLWIERTALLASDGEASHWFGYSSAILGDQAFVGAPRGDDVYVFAWDRREWAEVQHLVPQGSSTYQAFGWALAVEGALLVVGAPVDADARGAAYVFARQAGVWTQQAELVASDGESDDRFGSSVAIDADTIAVGAIRDDDQAGNAGAVYVFVRTGATWTQQAKLTASDAAFGDELGWSVAVDGDTLAGGAHWDDDFGTQSGAVYVYERTGTSWSEVQKLTASDASSTDQFGYRVALEGDTLAISTTRFGEPGTVYVFHPQAGVWTERAQLRASDSADADYFGESLALDGERIAVGGRLSDAGGPTSGAGYVFERGASAWTQIGLLVPIGVQPGDQYGRSIALDGDRVVLGSNYAEPFGSQSGRAATFHLEPPFQVLCAGDGSGAPCPCGNPGLPAHGCGNSASAAGASLTASGSPSVTTGGLVLHAAALPPGRIALFRRADAPIGGGAGQPFGDGLLCLAGNVLPVELVHADSQGLAATSVDLVATGNVLPGDRKLYQLQYRDPLGGPCDTGFNWTNGLDVSFVP